VASRPTLAREVRALTRTMSEAESTLGRTASPRRTLETRHRREPSHRREILVPAFAATVAVLAHVLDESHGADHGRRFLRGADGDRPAIVRVGPTRSPLATRPARRQHRSPDRRGDRRTDARS